MIRMRRKATIKRTDLAAKGRRGRQVERTMRAELLTMIGILGLAGIAVAQTPVLSRPEGATEVRRRRGAVLDCAEHGVWEAPHGWSLFVLERTSVALAPDGGAAIARAPARPPLTEDAMLGTQAARVVERLTGESPTLGTVEASGRNRWQRTRRVERWQRTRRVEGSVSVRGRTLRVVATSSRTSALWVGLSPEGDTAARAALDAAMGSWLMLTSHACQCGYDCDRRTW
jgi:hypothetical protein